MKKIIKSIQEIREHPPTHHQGGYIALVAVLIVLSGAVVLGVSLSLNGINELQLSFFERKSVEAFYLSDACMNEGLLRLRRDAGYTGGNLDNVLDEGESCEITVSNSGTEYTVQATGTKGDTTTRRIEAVVDTASGFDVTSWQEVGEF